MSARLHTAPTVCNSVHRLLNNKRVQRLCQIVVYAKLADFLNGFLAFVRRYQHNGYAVFFSYHAPEIDGMIYFSGKELSLGQFVQVKITDNMENNLIGEVVTS